MAELKTRPTDASVPAFIEAIADAEQRADAAVVADLMQEVTGYPPVMWGRSIVGFGSYEYASAGDRNAWPLVGFSPRSRELTLYIMPGFAEYGRLLERLGKHKTGRACLYIKRLADVDLVTLRDLVAASVEAMRSRFSSEDTLPGVRKTDPASRTLPDGDAEPATKVSRTKTTGKSAIVGKKTAAKKKPAAKRR